MESRGEGDVGLREAKVGRAMPGFGPPSAVSHVAIGSEGNGVHPSQVSGLREFDQAIRYRMNDVVDSSRNHRFDSNSVDPSTSDPLKFAAFSRPLVSNDINPPAIRTRTPAMVHGSHQNSQHPNFLSGENWGESLMADTNSPRTDTSTEDTEDKNQRFEAGQIALLAASDSSDRSKEKKLDQKTQRRLAQNREAARKSRLRKKEKYLHRCIGRVEHQLLQKNTCTVVLGELNISFCSYNYQAYVQQLENSRVKLTQLEQELQRARQQGIFISSSGDQSHSVGGNGALKFDMEYGRWLEEHNRQTNELRAAVNSHASDIELRTIVDGIMAHYKDIFKLKGIAAKADVFHMLSGMWKTPAERCFLWLGGFRSSELLKLLASQLEPLTEQQLKGIRNLQESSQQAEDALSQGMEALLQSLTETLASGALGPSGSSGNVANYMEQMAMAMGKLNTLENFLIQADNLRQQTLEQLLRILTTRQAARALLAISDYFSRLRALSSLWLARPRE